MKKKNIVNLIKYHTEGNDVGFRAEALSIAQEFELTGDMEIAEYIMSLVSSVRTFVPQLNDNGTTFFEKMQITNDPLPLPEPIHDDIINIINAINKHSGINKFLFKGSAGTGKTETAKTVARILNREIYSVYFSEIVDSRLGQTQKNLVETFNEINNVEDPDKVLFLFDEIDAIAMDRINNNDIREMGRTTSILLKELDKLDERVVIIATTNLFDRFDKSLIRRFDYIVDFDRYSKEDLIEVANVLLDCSLAKFKPVGRNKRLFNKILNLTSVLPNPSELKNIIKTSVAFCDNSLECDYLKRIYIALNNDLPTVDYLNSKGFTVREIEILTGVSKSKVSRDLNRGE